MGLGFLWAALYCHWFNPGFFPNQVGFGGLAHASYITAMASSAVFFFLLPYLSALSEGVFSRKMCIISGVFMAVSALLDYYAASVAAALNIANIVYLQHLFAALYGYGFATLWTAYGIKFSYAETELIETGIPASFIATPVILLLAQLISPSILTPWFAAIIALISAVPFIIQPVDTTNLPTSADSVFGLAKPLRKDFLKIAIGVVVIHAAVAFVWGSVSFGYFSSPRVGFGLPMLIGNISAIGIAFWVVERARSLNINPITRWCTIALTVALTFISVSMVFMQNTGRILLVAMQLVFNIFYLVFFCKMAHEGLASPVFSIALGRGFAMAGVSIGTVAGRIPFPSAISAVNDEFRTILIFVAALSLVAVFLLLGDGRFFQQNITEEGLNSNEQLMRTISRISYCDVDGNEVELTPREEEVLYLVLQGRNAPYIRDELYLSKNTVDYHMKNLYRKFGVHSRQELITAAQENQSTR